MIRKFDEDYKDLIVEDDGSPKRVLKSLEEEYIAYPEQKVNNITLFLLSQRSGGFVENFCLRNDNKDKLNDIRNNIEKNPDLLMNIVLVLDKYLPMSYDEFCKLNMFEQSKLLEKTKFSLKDEDLELFEKVFKDLSAKYKTKELKLDEIKNK
ncbi:MAG: hypothetical protein IKF37_00410 [Bacilli bacterium]|nr:hypothetical protein [Bacilli bacterium]